MFDVRHNPLDLQNLPMFKDTVTKFIVHLSITDDLKRINLCISAIEPDKTIYDGTVKLSFVPNQADFICKVLKKPIEVHTIKTKDEQ